MNENNRILPLFYNVEPSDVGYLKRSFGEAFDHQVSTGRHTSEKVQRWRDALNKVAKISGWDTKNFKTDKELVKKIVDDVCKSIQPLDIDFTMCTEDFEAYEATKKAMGEVMKALEDNEVTVVGVVGMGGVGKTTMVQAAAAQSKKSGAFNSVITLVVSQSPDLIKLQDTLAGQLGVELKEKRESVRAGILMREMMRRKKILIILDDVWKGVKLPKIGIPIYKESQRCNYKVVLTTRKKKVINDMRCERGITLDILSPEDSWSLFKRNAGPSLAFMRFEGLARRVAGECAGLPIALKAVARALRDEDEEKEWEKAAERLEKSQYANPNHEEDGEDGEDDKNVVKCMRLSYDYLKNEDQKSYFLLCCLYPEDHEIEIEDLLRYAVRTTFFQNAETIKEARGTLVTVVLYLKHSSLLSDSQKIGCVKMHDVIRDVAIRIAESECGFRVKVGFGLKDWPRGLDGGCTTVSLMRNQIRKLPEEELVCPLLQIILLNRNADLDVIPEKFIKSLSELRVLDVSNTSISILPQSFSVLTNLQGLYLDDCEKLMDISMVGTLKKLEILSMRNCPPMELPREIGHLNNLRILDVNRFEMTQGMVTIPSEVISKLHKLEELYMFCCRFEDWGCEVEERGEETSVGFGEIAGLSYLKRLQIGIPDVKYIPENVEGKPDWDYFYVSIIDIFRDDMYNSDLRETENRSDLKRFVDHNSRSLSLNGATVSSLPDWFTNAMTKKIEKLEYECCGLMSDIIVEYDRGRLHELKYLRVCGALRDGCGSSMKELMNTTERVQKGPVFEKLEKLHLSHL